MRQFEYPTQAVLRYIQLYQLKSTPRSIPLGTKKTHVGRTDSRGRWQEIDAEFVSLAQVFPLTYSEEWYLLGVSVMSNKGSRERCQFFNEQTQLNYSPYVFERRTTQAYRDLRIRLKERDMLLENVDGE